MIYRFQETELKFQSELLTRQKGERLFIWVKKNRAMLKDMKGVYYYKSNTQTIYIGKAKNLYQRMIHHCKEMLPHLCSEIKKQRDKKWIDAFCKFSEKEVEVYFIEVDDEIDRQWLEKKMQIEHKTVFQHNIQN